MEKKENTPYVFVLISRDLTLNFVSEIDLFMIQEGLGWNIQPGVYLPELIQEDLRDYFISQLENGFSGQCFSFNILFPCIKQGVKHCEVLVTPAQFEEGKVSKVGLAIRCTDAFHEELTKITENGLFGILFNSVSMGICITDRYGRFVEVNQEYCRIYGFDREELVGKNFTLVVDPAHRDFAQQLHDDFFIKGEELPAEFDVIAKDGSRITISVFSDKLVTPDGEEFKVTSIQDISNLKNLENQLESMTRNIPGIVLRYILMPDGKEKLLYVSDGLNEFFGLSPKEAMEDVNLIWSRIDSEDIPGMKESVRISAETLQIWKYEWKFFHTDGTIHWHRAKGNPHRLSDGSIIWDSIILDVTNEKNAERALEESEIRFEKLISEGVEMIAILDAEGYYIYNSKSYQTKLGYDSDELKGVRIFSIIHPDDVSNLLSEFQQVLTKKYSRPQPYRIKCKNGEYVWLKCIGTNLIDDPQIRGIVINSADVTELIQVKMDLESSENRYKYLFENNPGAMMVWDLENGKILDVNQSTCELYGYSYTEFLELTVYDIRPSEEVPKFQKKAKTENWSSDVGMRLYFGVSRHLRKNGEPIDVEVNAQMVHMDGRRVSLVLLHDVTEKLKTETELAISEEKYRSFFNLSPLPKMIFQRDSLRFLDVNEMAIKNYGYTREEFLNINLDDIWQGNVQSTFLEYFKTELLTGSVSKHPVQIHRRKDGGELAVDIYAQRIIYQGLDSIMIVAPDMTEKILGEQLNHLELHLMEEVILADSNLEEILKKFIAEAESILPEVRISLLRVEDKRLFNLYSPSLSQNYLNRIEGVAIGPNVGSCGMAAFFGHQIVSQDIASDPNWSEMRGLILEQGIKSSNSIPVFNESKEVVAVLCFYILENKRRDLLGLDWFQRAASLISLIFVHYGKKDALKLSNERYEYVNLATEDALYDWDVASNKLYWGKSYLRFIGASDLIQDLEIHDWAELIHPGDQDRVVEILQNDLSNPEQTQFKAEYQFRKQDGTYVYVVDRAYIVRDTSGKAIRVVGSLSNVTHQRLEELRLKLLESVITNANDAVIITEAEPVVEPGPRIVYVNDAFTRMTGYTAEEVLGKNPRMFQGPKTNPDDFKVLRNALKYWQSCEVTTVNYNKRGEEFWVNFSISPVADSKGWFTHWISIQRDVTQQKIEEQKKNLASKIVQLFAGERKFISAMEKSLEELVRFYDLDGGEIWLVNSDKTKLNFISRYANSEAGQKFNSFVDKNITVKKGEGLAGKIWKRNQPILIDERVDVGEFPRKDAILMSGLTCAFGLPLYNNHEIIGVVLFSSVKKSGFVNSVLDSLSSICQMLGSEIHRKKMEEELSQIFETAQDFICIMGFDGYFKRINKGAVYTLGYSEEELLSLPFNHFLHPDDRFESEDEMIHLIKGQNLVHFVNRFITKEGDVVWLDWNCTAVQEEELIYSVAKNITEEKELQNLLESANKMAKIGFWEVDVIRNTLYWSSISKEIHEVSSDFMPTLENAIQFYAPEAIPVISESFNRCLEFGDPYDLELPLITSKGNSIWIRTQGQAEFREGVCVRIFGTIQDITTQRATQEMIKLSNERLESRALELARSNAELEQFAYVASHDLQEPLRMVSSFLSQLEIKYSDQLDERARKYIYFAVDGAKRMRQIILDLLEFSRVGRMNGEKEEINLAEIMDEVCELQYNLIQSKNANISWDKLPVIKGFRTLILQVFQNLISNAIKYSKEGVSPEVKISCTSLPGFWEFSVEDNGIGMEEDSFEKIFVIFQRLHTIDKYSGSGIGLAIVKKIVENLGGKIWVESAPGVGTTFRFTMKK